MNEWLYNSQTASESIIFRNKTLHPPREHNVQLLVVN